MVPTLPFGIVQSRLYPFPASSHPDRMQVLPSVFAAGFIGATMMGGCTARAPACFVHAPSDAERGLALDACDQATARYTELFGEAPPRTRVTVADVWTFSLHRTAEQWELVWPGIETLSQIAHLLEMSEGERESFQDRLWQTVLPHEIGHAFVLGRFPSSAERGDAADPEGGLPGWFEEALAIAMEPEPAREARLSRARLAEPPPSLSTIAKARHPLAGHTERRGWTRAETFTCVRDCPEGLARTPLRIVRSVLPDGRVQVDTFEASQLPSERDAGPARFYALSYAALAFVHAYGGAAGIQELSRRIEARIPDTLVFAGLPGVAHCRDELHSQWEAWLAADPGPRIEQPQPHGP